MKKLIIGATVFAATIAVIRRFGPALGKRAMAKCEGMFDRMPEDFPPKRMVRSLEEIHEQTTRILRHLEETDARPAVIGTG